MEFITPIIAMVSGIISLYVDPKDSQAKWIKPLMLSLVVLTAIATIVSSCDSSDKAKQREDDLIKRNDELIRKNDELKAEMKALRESTQSIHEDTTTIRELMERGASPKIARTATPEQVRQSDEATQRLELALKNSNNQDIERRKTITVMYYTKDFDKNIVVSLLKNLGFKFEISESNPNLKNEPTNAVWFGSNVNIEDVKIVASTLIGAGLQIKTIQPSQKPQSASTIQVGHSVASKDRPLLTVEQIWNAKSFPKN